MRHVRQWIALVAMAALACACAPRGVPGPRFQRQRITVVEFSLEGAIINYDEEYKSFGLVVAEEIAARLRERGFTAEAVPAAATPPTGVVVRGRVTRLDGGSRALRYFVGFGAGRARFAAAGQVDQDGTRVASFAEERGAAVGIFGGSSSGMLQDCVRTLGRDIATMIEKGEYRTRIT